MKNSLPFLHAWKLERLFSFTSGSEKMWDYSGVFPAGGYGWKLALKFGELNAKEGKGYLSLFLSLVDASPPPFNIEVVLESSILDQNYSQCSKRKVVHRFQQSKSEEYHPYLISLETLECPSSGFLVAEIIDVVIHSEEDASLSPKSESGSLAYTWKIDGFSKLTKQKYTSGPFLYNDHIWCSCL
ncbi:hypothetical protein Taro_011809 [Colocasia esculenta]|uniref:MATH domain-containing protein n=1 Tax=Colocasia esculenta TaxID=4460 RepID=A0A843UB53_COLES|nr:hypothetical protein [Colocasia esculenta]